MTHKTLTALSAALCASTVAAAEPPPVPPTDPIYTMHVIQKIRSGRSYRYPESINLTQFDTSQACLNGLKSAFANVYGLHTGYCVNQRNETVVRCHVTQPMSGDAQLNCSNIAEYDPVAVLPPNQTLSADTAGFVQVNNDAVYFTRSKALPLLTYSYYYKPENNTLCRVEINSGARADICRSRAALEPSGIARKLADLGADLMRDFQTTAQLKDLQTSYAGRIGAVMPLRDRLIQLR